MFCCQHTQYFLFLTVIEKDKLEDEQSEWENKQSGEKERERAREISDSHLCVSAL